MEQKKDDFIVTMTASDLTRLIESSVYRAIEKFKENLTNNQPEDLPELIPRKEVAKLFNISLVSLDKWRRKGLLPKPVKQGSRVYYKKDEILELIENRGNNRKTHRYE